MIINVECSLKPTGYLDIEGIWGDIKKGLISFMILILWLTVTIFNFLTLGILGFIIQWVGMKNDKKKYPQYEGYRILFFGKGIYEKIEVNEK